MGGGGHKDCKNKRTFCQMSSIRPKYRFLAFLDDISKGEVEVGHNL